MKKAKLLIFIAALLCLAAVLGACGPSQMPLKKMAFESEPISVLTANRQLSDLAGTYNSDSQQLVLLCDTNATGSKYTVYNLNTEKSVFTYQCKAEQFATVELQEAVEEAFFYVCETKVEGTKTSYSTTLYDANGTAVHSIPYLSTPDVSLDLVKLGNNTYRVAADGTLSQVNRSDLAVYLPDFDYFVNGYYYTVSSSDFTVYDDCGCPINRYSAPSYAVNITFGILNSGNVLIQYLVSQDSEAKDYDLLRNDNKYNIVTELYKAKNGKTEERKSDYVWAQIIAHDAMSKNLRITGKYISDKIENVGIGYEIIDRRINQNNEHIKILSLDKQGDAKALLNDLVPNQGNSLPETIGNGYMVLVNEMDQAFLYDSNNKQVGEISACEDFTRDYICTGTALYNYSLQKVYDYAENGYTLFGVLDCAVLLKNENNDYYIYGTNGLKQIVNHETQTFITFKSSYYCIKGESDYYYYNSIGDLIATTSVPLSKLAESDSGKLLMVGINTSGLQYYLFY